MNAATFRPATGMHVFAASHLDGLLQHRTEQEVLCFWPCPHGYNEVVFEGFMKCEGGLRHLVHRYDRATIHGTALDTLEHGTFSPRPYQLAQACDGSIIALGMALIAAGGICLSWTGRPAAGVPWSSLAVGSPDGAASGGGVSVIHGVSVCQMSAATGRFL